jgi:hypothetical protein
LYEALQQNAEALDLNWRWHWGYLGGCGMSIKIAAFVTHMVLRGVLAAPRRPQRPNWRLFESRLIA